MQDHVVDTFAAGHAPRLDLGPCVPKQGVEFVGQHRAVDLVQKTIGRRHNRDMPAGFSQRYRKVAHDIADATDLAPGQRAVFGGKKDYGSTVYGSFPSA